MACTGPPPQVCSDGRYVWEVQHNQGSLVFLVFLTNCGRTPAFFRHLWDPSFQDQDVQSLSYPWGRLDCDPDHAPWIHHWRWHPCGIQYIFRKVHWSECLDLGGLFLKLHLSGIKTDWDPMSGIPICLESECVQQGGICIFPPLKDQQTYNFRIGYFPLDSVQRGAELHRPMAPLDVSWTSPGAIGRWGSVACNLNTSSVRLQMFTITKVWLRFTHQEASAHKQWEKPTQFTAILLVQPVPSTGDKIPFTKIFKSTFEWSTEAILVWFLYQRHI